MKSAVIVKGILAVAIGLGTVTATAGDARAYNESSYEIGDKTDKLEVRYEQGLKKLTTENDVEKKSGKSMRESMIKLSNESDYISGSDIQVSDAASADETSALIDYIQREGEESDGYYYYQAYFEDTEELIEGVEIGYNPADGVISLTYFYTDESDEEIIYFEYDADELNGYLDNVIEINRKSYTAYGQMSPADVRLNGIYTWYSITDSYSLGAKADTYTAAYLDALIPVALVYVDAVLGETAGVSLYGLGFSYCYYPVFKDDSITMEVGDSYDVWVRGYPSEIKLSNMWVFWHYPNYMLYETNEGNLAYFDALQPGTGAITVILLNGAKASIPVTVTGEQPARLSDFTFDDVADPDKYYYIPVYSAYDKKITTGTSASLFSPNETVTRGQIVTFLYRACGSPFIEGTHPFIDVKRDKYYYKAVLWAYQEGITTGVTPTEFKPDDPCTREQIVTFIWRCLDSATMQHRITYFTDIRQGAYYLDALSWASDNCITTGLNDGTGRFGVGMKCTRAMAVTFLYRSGVLLAH